MQRVDIAADAVRRAVHLTARDEWRYNFSLNSLRGPDSSPPEHTDKWVLSGPRINCTGPIDEQDQAHFS